ncbi:hypothetical protein HaLaN_31735 [Haematococcus lacustris]|uniref:Uncharacterized protein n=1 Tax=Haematococcus lacustris TaxID=44745 RepID=A0A6A0AJL4_HAELA|nr:hypothetical protein HaLaN_31735 [Haematococcus lacustris]
MASNAEDCYIWHSRCYLLTLPRWHQGTGRPSHWRPRSSEKAQSENWGQEARRLSPGASTMKDRTDGDKD